MSTLLQVNEQAALVGDLDGNVRTEPIPLTHDYTQPAHATETDEYYTASRAGNLDLTENPGVRFLHKTEVQFPFRTYKDDANGLSVRAAFDTGTKLWVVADLKVDAAATDASLSSGAI
jgi:hypothetical protein